MDGLDMAVELDSTTAKPPVDLCRYTKLCVYIYVYLFVYTYMYIYVYVCICICI